MPRQRKFVPGEPVRSIHAVVGLIQEGRWLYFRDKPLSPKWLENMSVQMLRIAAHGGHIRLANPNPVKGTQNG